nr:LysR family transcriptional regulator [Massilia eburnea]
MDARIDLNLFRVLDAIYQQGGITAAARSLHLTQPAVTHALNRLREHFGDPLFVRQGNSVVPTERTLAVIEAVQSYLQGLQGTLRSEAEVRPEMLDAEMTMGSRDMLESMVLPALAATFAAEAPRLKLASRRVPLDEVERALAGGQLDLVFERRIRVGPRVASAYIFDESHVVVMRRDHPLANGSLTRAEYFAARHVSVSPMGEPNTLDVLLGNDGRQRQISLFCQHHFAACQIVASGDLLLTLPRFYALKMAELLPIVVKRLPLGLKPYPIFAYWHVMRNSDRIHQWFRDRAINVVREASKVR